jgi:UDP-glucose 4-epimerase
MRRYVVTGGAGFIGSHVAEALLARGDAVTIVDDLSSGRRTNLDRLSGKLDVEHADIGEASVLARVTRGAAGIVHLAAVASVPQSIADPARCTEVNVGGTVQVLEAAHRAGVARVVLAASAAAYGDREEGALSEDAWPRPLSPYAASKIAAEHYLRVYAHLHAMKTVSLRYFNVFGPYQDPQSEYAAVVPKFASRLLAGEAPVVFGDGLQTRDFCYVENVVAANLRALEWEGAAGQVVNIANGGSTTILELARTLAALIGVTVEPVHAEPRAGDVRHSRADITRARELLGWEPAVSVEEGLRRTVAALRVTAPPVLP